METVHVNNIGNSVSENVSEAYNCIMQLIIIPIYYQYIKKNILNDPKYGTYFYMSIPYPFALEIKNNHDSEFDIYAIKYLFLTVFNCT